ncbi:MAG: ABC transporter permease [Chloroflexota bacterium]|nr:ABC transporter permease [Chloroflexota bacterium]
MGLTFSPTVIALALASLTSGTLFLLIGQIVRHPLFLQIGLRNVRRYRSQTALMIAGLALSSLFMTGMFGLSDSMNHSQESYRRLLSGNVDEAVTGPLTQDQVTQVLARLQRMPEVAHASASVMLPRSTTITVAGLALTQVDILAIPPDFDHVYGPISTNAGQPVHFQDLRPDEVLITPALAQRLEIKEGDSMQMMLEGQTVTRRARAILAHDVVMTTGELQFNGSYPLLLMPLAAAQQIYQQAQHAFPAPNLIAITNAAPEESHSAAVNAFLSQFLHASPDPFGSIPTNYNDVLRLHPIKPDIVQNQGFFTPVAGKDEVAASPAARQFNYLLPIFTALLVGAGLLLQVLLVLLLATERRTEFGISRAVGIQRGHLILMLLIECTGYGVMAFIPGILGGGAMLASGLTIFSHLPSLGLANQISYQFWLSWQSIVSIWCLGILTTLGAALLTALWISRDTIVAAIGNLKTRSTSPPSLRARVAALFFPPRDDDGQLIPETAARRFSRRAEAFWSVLYALFVRGPLVLLLAAMVALMQLQQTTSIGDLDWRDVLPLLTGALLIAGGGLLLNWLLSVSQVARSWAWRISMSLIGGGWLFYGLSTRTGFLFAFEATWNRMPSFLSNMLSMVIPLLGGVIVVVSNADLLARLAGILIRHVRGWTPLSRIGLVYPLTFRFRTGVTVALLGLVTFLVLLLITNNESFLQQQQQTNGGFQLTVRVSTHLHLNDQLLNTPVTFKHDIAAVGRLRRTYFARRLDGQPVPYPIRVLLPGHDPAIAGYTGPEIVDTNFLSQVSLPLLAHAQGYNSDSQVWTTMCTHAGYALLYYQNGIQGLQPQQNFVPFQIDVPDGDTTVARYHRLTVIGLMPSTSPWRSVLISSQTARTFGWNFEGDMPWPWSDPIYYFKLQNGTDPIQVMRHLSQSLHLGERGVQINRLDDTDATRYTSSLTTLLAGYMAFGLLFGMLSLGVIMSRAVVERRQQIGLLRALGFSRSLILRAFLLESSFIITLGLFTGTALAGLVVYQISRQGAQTFPLPIFLMLLLLGSCYVVASVFTAIPTWRASHISPAEALRYE